MPKETADSPTRECKHSRSLAPEQCRWSRFCFGLICEISVICGGPRPAGSVLRPSTGAEVTHVFTGLEHHGRRIFARIRHLSVDLFEVRL
jgi:hypothetical protein